MSDAATAQYGTPPPDALPYTGADVSGVFILAVIVIALGLILRVAIRPGRTRPRP